MFAKKIWEKNNYRILKGELGSSFTRNSVYRYILQKKSFLFGWMSIEANSDREENEKDVLEYFFKRIS